MSVRSREIFAFERVSGSGRVDFSNGIIDESHGLGNFLDLIK